MVVSFLPSPLQHLPSISATIRIIGSSSFSFFAFFLTVCDSTCPPTIEFALCHENLTFFSWFYCHVRLYTRSSIHGQLIRCNHHRRHSSLRPTPVFVRTIAHSMLQIVVMTFHGIQNLPHSLYRSVRTQCKHFLLLLLLTLRLHVGQTCSAFEDSAGGKFGALYRHFFWIKFIGF